MLPTVKQFIQTCKDEDFKEYFQDYVFSLQNEDASSAAQLLNSKVWSLKGVNNIDRMLTDMQYQLKELIQC